MATAAVHDVSREPRDPGGRWTVGGQHESWPDYPTFQQTWDAAVRDPRRASTSDLGRALMYGSSILGSLSRQIRAGNQQYMPAYRAFEGEFSTLQDAMRDRKWSEPGPYESSDEPADEDYESNLMVEEGHVTPPWLQDVMDEYSKRGAAIKYAEDEDRREDDVPLHKGPHWVNLDGARALVDENGQILKACKGLKGYNLDELDETAEERSDKQEAAEDAGWESAETKRARDTWTKAKKQAPEAVVVVRSGDKFFAFNADAQQLQALSQLGNGETAQFDAEKLEHHIGQLIEGGHRVAVVDRTESGEPDFSSEADKETQQAVANAELSDQDVLKLIQDSPQLRGLQRNWDAYAKDWGVTGQKFRRVDLPVSTIVEFNRSGRLYVSKNVSRGDIDRKKASGTRNPVIISAPSGKISPLAVLDGTHSLHAAAQAGDKSIPVILSDDAAKYLGLSEKSAAAKPEGENPQKPQHGDPGFAVHVMEEVAAGNPVPEGTDELIDRMAAEAVENRESVSQVMRRHGVNPMKARGFHAVLVDAMAKHRQKVAMQRQEAEAAAQKRQPPLQGIEGEPATPPQAVGQKTSAQAFLASSDAYGLFSKLRKSDPEFKDLVAKSLAQPDPENSPEGKQVTERLLQAAQKEGVYQGEPQPAVEQPRAPEATTPQSAGTIQERHAATGSRLDDAPRTLQRLFKGLHGLRDTRKTGQVQTKDVGADYAKGMHDYLKDIAQKGDGFGDVYDLSAELGHGALGYASPAGNLVMIPPMMKGDDWDVRYSVASPPAAAPTVPATQPATPQAAPAPQAPTPPEPKRQPKLARTNDTQRFHQAMQMAAELDMRNTMPLLHAFERAHGAGWTGRDAQSIAAQLYFADRQGDLPENMRDLKSFNRATKGLEEMLRPSAEQMAALKAPPQITTPEAASAPPPPPTSKPKKRVPSETSPKAKLDQAIKDALGNWTTPQYRQEFRKALDEAWEEKRQEIEGRNRAVDRVLGNFGWHGPARTKFLNSLNRKDSRGNYLYDDHDSFRNNSEFGHAFDQMADFAERYTPEILQGHAGMTAEDALFDRLRRGAKEEVPPKHDDQFIQAAFAKMGEGPGYEGEDDEKARQIANDPEWQEIMARPFARDGWKMRYEKWAKQKLSRWRKYARQLAFTFDEQSHPRATETVTIEGTQYRPGEWIPAEQAAQATPAEAAKIEDASVTDVGASSSNEALAVALQAGNRPAAEHLIRNNMGFVQSIARKYARNPDELSDLMQEGCIALLSAANEFDSSRGLKFTTFAFYPVRQVVEKSAQQMHRQGLQLVGDEERGDVMAEVPEREESPQRWSPEVLKKLEVAVSELPEKERSILELKFGFGGREPLEYGEIGATLGVSKQYVHKVATGAMQRLAEKIAKTVQAAGKYARLRREVIRYVQQRYPRKRKMDHVRFATDHA